MDLPFTKLPFGRSLLDGALRFLLVLVDFLVDFCLVIAPTLAALGTNCKHGIRLLGWPQRPQQVEFSR